MTGEPALLECAVEADVGLADAWAYRTDVTTWDDPPAIFSLDGPFAPGSRGTTLLPGREPLRWMLESVERERSFTIEMPLAGASLYFEWLFEAVAPAKTRLTHRIRLTGSNAAAHAPAVREAFGATLEDGMRRLAATMTRDAGR